MKKIFSIIFILIAIPLLTGCSKGSALPPENKYDQKPTQEAIQEVKFTGEKGVAVDIADSKIVLDSKTFDDGLAHYYNTQLRGKTVYFFVVKDKDGIYRAAANACQVCANSKMGFEQDGNFMVCNTCGNKYPLEKIATERGGCNPVPINPNLKIKDGQVIIDQSDLNQIISFF